MSEAIAEAQIYWDMVSTQWSIALSGFSLLLAVISVVLVLLTIFQNKKMIESASRPYIGITGEFINNGISQYKLVLKNYGQSEGTITAFEPDKNLRGFLGSRKELAPFGHIVGATLLPGQCLVCTLDRDAIHEDLSDYLNVSIKYKSDQGKEYPGIFHVPFGAFIDIPTSHTGGNNDDCETSLHNISFTLQTISEKLL